MFPKFCGSFSSLGPRRLKPLINPYDSVYRCLHFNRKFVLEGLNPELKLARKTSQSDVVGIFWDLDNKPPNSIPPYEAANKLKKAAFAFGNVKYMVAYANPHVFSWVPKVVKDQRNERNLLNKLESKGVIKAAEQYVCRVCGRGFYADEKFINHFKQIHETEHRKRVNQIESTRGTMRVKLVAKYSMKMEKYKNAVQDVLIPKVGYGLADELKRAGFWVRTVPDKPQSADLAWRDQVVEMMDRGKVQCLVLVSDDSDFVGILKEAKMRRVKTVVVGDIGDGALKRVADAGFSWAEILRGKAQKDSVTVVSKWKDLDVLKRLEWEYNPEEERGKFNLDDDFEDLNSNEDIQGIEDADYAQKEDVRAWWKLDSDSDASSSQPH